MSVRKSLAMDALALVLFAASLLPGLTGVAAHEWLSLVITAVFLSHIVVHVHVPKKTGRDLLNDGVASERKVSSEVDSRSAVPSEILRGSFGRLRAANLVVDAALFVVLALVTISGLGVSGAVLPTLGLYADGYYFWNPLHAAAAKALLALLIVHLAFHMKYVVVLLRRNHG